MDRAPDPQPKCDSGYARNRHGFALLTVLFGLAVVTVLVGASINRTVAHVKIARHAIRAQQDAALHEAVIEIASAIVASRPDDLPREPLQLRIGIRVGDRGGGSAATIQLTNGRRVEVAVVALASN